MNAKHPTGNLEKFADLLEALSVSSRQSKQYPKPRVDKDELANWLYSLVEGDIKKQLTPPGEGQLIIVEKCLDDPLAGDLLLAALKRNTDLDVFQYKVETSDGAGNSTEEFSPAVFDMRFLRREVPSNQEASKSFDAKIAAILKVTRQASSKGKRVILLCKRARHIPKKFWMPNTQRVSLTPLDCEDLAAACKNLFENHSLPIELDPKMDAVWVQRLVPSDFLENASSNDQDLIDNLYNSVMQRLGRLGGDIKVLPLNAFPGRRQVKQWPELIVQAFRHGTQEVWLRAGRGTVLKVGDAQFGEIIAKSVADWLGIVFIPVSAEDFLDQPLDWLDRADDLAPSMLHIRHGAWQRISGIIESMQSAPETLPDAPILVEKTQRMLNSMMRFDPRAPVLLTTVVSNFEQFDEAFLHPEIFSRQIDAGSYTFAELGRIILSMIGKEYCSSALWKKQNIEKIGKLFEGKLISPIEIVHLRRKSLDKRLLRFSDIVDMKLRGTVDADTDSKRQTAAERRMTAYHEAGHAAMMMIAWKGEHVPDYASIIPNNSAGDHFEGVVFADVGALFANTSLTFQEMRRHVRKLLAGRAGEQIIGGPENISNGAMSDLQKATAMATEAFALYGFSPDMETRPGANLAVTQTVQVSRQSADGQDLTLTTIDILNQRTRIADMVRSFLEVEYNETLRLLEANRSLFDAIAERLLRSPILGREELRSVLKAHIPFKL